jgi:hypothetical protein
LIKLLNHFFAWPSFGLVAGSLCYPAWNGDGSAILYGADCNLVDRRESNLDLGQGFGEALKQE